MLEPVLAVLAGVLLIAAALLWQHGRRPARAPRRARRRAPPPARPSAAELDRLLGTVAGSLGHELANLSSSVEGHAQLLCEAVGEPTQIADAAERLCSSVRRLRLFSEKLLACAAPRRAATERTDVAALLAGLRQELEAHLGVGFQVTVRCAPELPDVRGDAAALRHAILFFVDAVLGIEPDAATVLLRAAPQLDDDDGGVELELLIESEADSRPASMRELTVELGHRAAANLLAACGATLEVTRIAGLGARATIQLPAAPEPTAPAARARAAPLLAAHPFGGVLIADGDAALRDMISSAVEASGRNVVVAPTGRHARELFLRTPERFELLVLEQDARQLAGDELALEALAHPAAVELRILLLGNGRDPTRADQLHPDRCTRIDKPFGLMELRDALAVLIAPAERVR